MNKKKILLSLSVLLLLVLALLGVTYAYYRTRVIGNKSNESISVTSKTLGITYSDNNAAVITGEDIVPSYLASKTFSVANNGTEEAYFNIIFDNVTNGFNKGIEERGEYNDWVYRLYSGNEKLEDESNLIECGDITTAVMQVLTTEVIKGNSTNNYYLEVEYLDLEDINQSADMGQRFSLRLNISDAELINPYNEGTLAYSILNSAVKGENGTRYVDASLLGVAENTSIPAESVSLENESIISYTDDDYTESTGVPSYYFRGDVEDNYVTFARMCFRIVRIDGDGNVKLILEDQDEPCSESMNGNWDIEASDGTTITMNGSAPYRTGNFGYDDSTGKYKMSYLKPVDYPNRAMVNAFKYFQTNTLTNKITSTYTGKIISDFLASGNWCLNNKAYSDKTGANLLENPDYTSSFYYDSYIRLYEKTTKEPSLKCSVEPLYKFDDNQDGAISNNETDMYVGTITADEIVYIGGKINEDNSNYYLINKWQSSDSSEARYFFSLSPRYFNGKYDSTFIVSYRGTLYNHDVGGGNYGVFRPALSLIKNITLDTTVEGQNGTKDHPYLIG